MESLITENLEDQTIETTISTMENSISTSSSSEDDVSASTLTSILEKIAEIVTENSETTESFDSSTFSPIPAIFQRSNHFNPIDYVVFGVMLAMSGEHLKFNDSISY